MKNYTICTIFLFVSMVSFSQEIILTGDFNLHYDVFSITENNNNFKQRIDAFDPAFSLGIAYLPESNIILQTGLSYSKFGHNIGIRNLYFPDTYGGQYICVMEGISVPINFGYRFNISKRLDISLISGIGFTYYFNSTTGVLSANYWQTTDTTINKSFIFDFSNALKQNFNIFLTNKFSLTYKTKGHLCYSLSVMYNSGFYQIWEETAHLEINNASEVYDASITSNGSNWGYGISVGYIFDRAKKFENEIKF